MKYSKFFIVILAVALIMPTQSCKKFLDVNTDPNYPADVIPRVLLPASQANMAYAQGGDMARYTAIMSQYITGASRQFFTYNLYSFNEEDFNNLWNNVYAATMVNYFQIMRIADEKAGLYDTYDGVAHILMAYALAATSDLWGDVPYSEAFLGNENLQPNFDSQQDVYTSIQQLLDDGIEILNNPDDILDDDLEVPGSDDFIYSGDVDSWIAFAHALKARYYLHLTKVDANAAQNALNEINTGGPIATAEVIYSSTGPSPWYQYIEQRDDIAYDGACLQLMQANSDPRYAVYIDVNGDYWGVGYLGPFFSADNAATTFMTEFERLFISAEAKFRTGDLPGANADFGAAIQASMDYYGIDPVDAAAYILAHGVLNVGTELEQMMTEKWIANFLHPESWTDWRRTGFPVLTPNSGSEIPRRFIYPTNERLYNPNIADANSSMFSPKLWWDQ